MKDVLIAPCGMNCKICVAFQFKEKDLSKKGFHRKYRWNKKRCYIGNYN